MRGLTLLPPDCFHPDDRVPDEWGGGACTPTTAGYPEPLGMHIFLLRMSPALTWPRFTPSAFSRMLRALVSSILRFNSVNFLESHLWIPIRPLDKNDGS